MKSECTVILVGGVTRDAETKIMPTGKTRCTFSVATNRHWIDGEGNPQTLAEFHNVVCWESLAEVCSTRVLKGMPIYVKGYLKTRSWPHPKYPDVMIFHTEVHAENVIFLDSAK